MSEFQTVALLADVPENELRGVEVSGKRIVLANRNGVIYALEDRCSHEEFPLSSGELTGAQITCALRGARFDLASGAPRALPAVKGVPTYEVRVEGEEIQLKL